MNARDLSARLSELLRREHESMADFLVALADFDRHRLWVDLGHPNLFSFLHRDLGLSKGAAFYRKTAAELLQRCPEVIEPLRDGRLCFTSVVELAKVLTPENRDEVLPRFFHRSKREAREVVAELKPIEAPPRREVVTAVRAPAPAAPATLELPVAAPSAGSPAAQPGTTEPRGWPAEHLDANSPRATAHAPSSRDSRDDRVEPLTAELRRFHLTVSRGFLDKIDAARDALSHSHQGASAEDILEVGLDLILARHAKRKGLVAKPRKERRPAEPDYLPAEVKRAVWLRDGGCCQWHLHSGGICGSRRRIEFDHRRAKALGGPPTVENVRLLCKFHNLLAARQAFGDDWMDQFTGTWPKAEPLGCAAARTRSLPGAEPPQAEASKRSG